MIPLLIGIPLFVYPVVHDPLQPSPGPVYIGLFLIMVGLVVGGSWLTMQAARIMAKRSRGASSLLAARRLADNPKAAFRSVSGLVLAVFVGTGIAGLAPAVNAAQSPTSDVSLNDVLRVPWGLPPQTAAELIRDLQVYPGVTVVPIYANPSFRSKSVGGSPAADAGGSPFDSVIGCASLEQLPVLGACAPGAKAVMASAPTLFSDNPLYISRYLPLVNQASPVASDKLTGLSVSALLVKTDNEHTLERVRTFLTSFNAVSIGAGG